MADHAVLFSGIGRSIVALLLAAIVVMGSPGPSTMSATAVGAAYGFGRSLRYVGGLILGTTAVLFAVAVGVVTILLAIPYGATVLIAASSVYILYIAFRIATAPPLAAARAQVAAPAFTGGFLFALANPKAYLAIGAVFASTSIFAADRGLDAAVKIVLLTGMIVVVHLGWLSVGATLARVLQHPVLSRIVNVTLAASLVAVTALTVLR
jgi:threonine/homoserine/homoserine lactone efflux protein